ncbi:MAG: MBOAT family protein, partial [Bacteroidales bacterium]|nr:MBOAT family protein [Bacteroidales bacterium]
YFLPLLLTKKNRTHLDIVAQDRLLPTPMEMVRMLTTFGVTVIAWVFFRAENLSHAFIYLKGVFSPSLLTIPQGHHFVDAAMHPVTMSLLLIFFMVMEWLGRRQQYAIEGTFVDSPRLIRWSLYAVLIFMVGIFAQTNEMPFIYFQF